MTDLGRHGFLRTSPYIGLATFGATILRPARARAADRAALQMSWPKSVPYAGIFIAAGDTLANRDDHVRQMLRAEIRGYQNFVQDIDLAVDLTVGKYAVDQGLDRAERGLQAEPQRVLPVRSDTTANWCSG